MINNVFLIFVDMSTTRFITVIKIQSSGNSESPRKCLLQSSVSSGVGPFVTVKAFTLQDVSTEQVISSFGAKARYWRLMILDNYGGETVSIREIALEVPLLFLYMRLD